MPFDLSVHGVEGHPSLSVYGVFLVDVVTIYVHGLEFHKHLKVQPVAPSCIQEKHKSGLGMLSSLKCEHRTQFLLPDAMESAIDNSGTTV